MKKYYFILLLSLTFADYNGGFAGSGFRYGSNAREVSMSGAMNSVYKDLYKTQNILG